jgi:hypothetical protein
MDPILFNYWPSIEQKDSLKFGFDGLIGPANEQFSTKAPLEIESFSSQIYEMKDFLKLLIQISFHKLLIQNNNATANKIYDGFFETRH